MIISFRHKGLKLLYEHGKRRGVPPERADYIEEVLSVLDVTTSIATLRLPGLHPLKGARAGEWSVRVSANWRIVFRIADGHVHDVDLTDYH
jgi:toxin HigB-1